MVLKIRTENCLNNMICLINADPTRALDNPEVEEPEGITLLKGEFK
jgi:hypothetical protein